MLDIINNFELTNPELLIIAICIILTGAAKTGIFGLTMLVIPIMASIFDPKVSNSIMLPMLIVGDLVATKHFKKDISWPHLIRLLPWTAGGIIIGMVVGDKIDSSWFKYLIASAIIIGLIPLLLKKKDSTDTIKHHHWSVSAIFGLAAGFFTMIGNAAGSLMSLYLISMDLPKNKFIGTRAWFFLIINLSKIPIHVFIWKSMTLKTIGLNIIFLPGIFIGALIGVRVVKKIDDKTYKKFIITLIIIAAVKLIFT